MLLLLSADLLPWRFAVQVESQEEMGMAPDKYREVFDLAQRGTQVFRDGHFDEVCLAHPSGVTFVAVSVSV